METLTGRDRLIICKALGYAIEAIGKLPPEWQEASDREDMILLLIHLSKDQLPVSFYISTAKRHLEQRKYLMEDESGHQDNPSST
jgi:hypothetical protein